MKLLAILFLAQVCGGPTYPCSLHQTNAQLTTIPLPSPIPSMGGLTGAGTCITLPIYGSTVCRLTDINTDSTNTKFHSFEVTDTGGDNVIQWNSNQRLLRIVRMATGSTGVIGWDPVAKAVTVMNPSSQVPTGPQWSLSNPNLDFYLAADNVTVKQRQWDYTKPLAAPITTTLFNLKSVCPMLSGMNISYNTQLVTVDDDTFSMALGVNGQHQDTAQYVVSYQVSVNRCWLLDTLTGDVQRSDCAGPVDMGTVSTFYPFTIHAVDQGPSGVLQVGVGTCPTCPIPHGPFFYYPKTTHVDLVTTKPMGGHAVIGNKVWVDATAAPELASRPLAGFSPVTFISSRTGIAWPLPGDTHYSWANDDANDTFPICGAESSSKQAQPIVIQAPLEQEIYCVDPTNGTYIRLAPTFTSGMPYLGNFRTELAILANGKLGYIAFSSDWEGSLGNADGKTLACTLGTVGATQCRSDVFMVIPQ